MSKGKVGGIISGVVIVILLIALISCTTKVPAGYVAVQYNMNGGVSDQVLTQGWHIVSPTTKTTLYSVSLEQSYLTASDQGDSPEDESFSASTKEGKAVQIELTYTYQYSPEEVTHLFTRFRGQSGKEVRDSFIKPNIVSWSKEVIARYAVADILGDKRADVNKALTEYLADKFNSYGIAVSNVSLINITVDENTSKAINQKIQAQQDAERQAIENQTNIDKAKAEAEATVTRAQADADAKKIEAENEAQIKVTQAEAQAETTKIAAEADAKATKIAADAEAEANKKLNESLTDEVLREKYIEKWNGQLPKYTGSDDISMIFEDGE